MLKIKDQIDLKIDSLAYGGEGVGKHEGMTVFVADAAPGDTLKVEIVSAKKNFAKGEIVEIVEPSPDRVKPFCALANACGGCQWQHIDYPAQLKAKKQIVEDSLNRIGKLDIPVNDVIPSPDIKEYRCKIQYPTAQTKVSKRFLMGYFKKGTHDIVNIKYCPIQPDTVNKIAEFIKEQALILGLSAYHEKSHRGLIRHTVFRYSSSDKNMLLIFVINAKEVPEELNELANLVKNQFGDIVGVLASFNTAKSNVIFGDTTVLLRGQDFIEENLEGRKFKISAGSFFQVNPPSAVNIFNTVKNIIEERLKTPTLLDVYSGVGSFSIWLKDIASKITAIEEYPAAVSDAKENITLNDAQNINIIEGNAQVALTELVEKNEKFDAVILDPPRKGCEPEAIEAVAQLADKYIIYVSCNPATLARDLKILKEKGFTPEFAQPVDMFCHTYHIESIVVLKNCNN